MSDRDYENAAAAARDSGIVDKTDVQQWAVEMDIQRFLEVEDENSEGARKLLRETTREAMEQTVTNAKGEVAGKRKELKTWEDRWGNIMYQHGSDQSTRTKLVDKSERGINE